MKQGMFKYRVVLYAAIPIVLLLTLLGQLKVVEVKSLHESLNKDIPIVEIDNRISGINAVTVLIPGIGPYLELTSVTSLFTSMKTITEEYSSENSYKVFKEMQKTYKEDSNFNKESIYLFNYNSTISSMLNFFESYSNLGPDSKVTLNYKTELNKQISLLQLISGFKIVVYLILFILATLGFFVFKGQYTSKDS